jgi:hypothetical protein
MNDVSRRHFRATFHGYGKMAKVDWISLLADCSMNLMAKAMKNSVTSQFEKASQRIEWP